LVLLIGTLCLAFAHQKTSPKTSWLTSIRFNGLFVGFLMTLVYLLAYATSPTIGFEHTLIPLIYGGLIHHLLGYNPSKGITTSETVAPPNDPFEVGIVSIILMEKGFSPREIHVAHKIMHHLPNKEIARDLFISEATVKKHIQNMFKKCDAQDRAHFTQIYLEWYRRR
jgi:DNA-binding CsgD family transcriptional regulator